VWRRGLHPGQLGTRGAESHWREHLDDLRVGIGHLRQANVRRLPPDSLAWNRLADAIRELPRALASPPPPPRDRFWASSQKALAYANRIHGTAYEVVSQLSQGKMTLTYLVRDASGQQAHLTWGRDTERSRALRDLAEDTGRVEIASGRTPSGCPYEIVSVNTADKVRNPQC
jgi:hypothetical protein